MWLHWFVDIIFIYSKYNFSRHTNLAILSELLNLETCLEERISNEYGTLEWPKVGVNSSQFLLCPFNTEREPVERRCHWDPEKSIAKWDDVLNEEKCKRQSSILYLYLFLSSLFTHSFLKLSSVNFFSVHLGVLASYVQRSDQRLLTLVKCSFPKNALFQFGHNCF